MQKILILLILTLLTLTSCNNINDNAEFDKGYNYDNYTEVGLSDDFNEFLGIWQVGMLKITPRVSLMDAEHAKTNSTVTGMVLDIKKDKVLFDDRVFYYRGYEEKGFIYLEKIKRTNVLFFLVHFIFDRY